MYCSKATSKVPFRLLRLYLIYRSTSSCSGSFVCSFDVFYYPFDTQLCSLLVQVASVSEDLVAFSPTSSRVLCLDEPTLPTYVIDQCLAQVTSWTNNHTRFSLLKVSPPSQVEPLTPT